MHCKRVILSEFTCVIDSPATWSNVKRASGWPNQVTVLGPSCLIHLVKPVPDASALLTGRVRTRTCMHDYKMRSGPVIKNTRAINKTMNRTKYITSTSKSTRPVYTPVHYGRSKTLGLLEAQKLVHSEKHF